MPIYEYKCSACGFQKDYLQKMSDTPLTTCPECHKDSFSKLLSAPGFQLTGSGWYATDFKGGAKSGGGSTGGSSGGTSSSASSEGGASASSNTSASSCSTACACH